jgi:potassium-transporting ATPase potassium-binding subunit
VAFTRIILTFLLPVALVSSPILMTIGVPQTLNLHINTSTLESIISKNDSAAVQQTINIGPVASFESITLLGSNGCGFFVSNSGHPFENPTGLSNMYEMFLMLIITLSFPIAYAKLFGKGKGISILLAMIVSFGILLVIALSVESGPLSLETRFGSFNSMLFNTISLAANTGAANSALSGTSSNAITSFLLAMFV